MQLLGGPGEVTQVRDGQETLELVEVHGSSLKDNSKNASKPEK
ncbi:hypothetical protein [Arthrobacter sp. JCM 19049]|nr:hypothetical protein [Arthrobacter sp. JCM 19049]